VKEVEQEAFTLLLAVRNIQQTMVLTWTYERFDYFPTPTGIKFFSSEIKFDHNPLSGKRKRPAYVTFEDEYLQKLGCTDTQIAHRREIQEVYEVGQATLERKLNSRAATKRRREEQSTPQPNVAERKRGPRRNRKSQGYQRECPTVTKSDNEEEALIYDKRGYVDLKGFVEETIHCDKGGFGKASHWKSPVSDKRPYKKINKLDL